MIGRSPYYANYSHKKKEELAKLSRYKIIILLLAKATQRNIKSHLEHIRASNKLKKTKMTSIIRIASRNHEAVIKSALSTMNYIALYSRNQTKAISVCTRMVQNIEKYQIKDSFSIILQRLNRKNSENILKSQNISKMALLRKMSKLLIVRKSQTFNQIHRYAKNQKEILGKVKLIGIISKAYVRHTTQNVFNRLMRHSAKKALSEACKNSNILSGFPTSNSQSTVSSNFSQIQKNQREEDMKIKVQDMEVQIDNKNETIFRLQQEIQQIKGDLTSQINSQKNNFSFSEYTMHPNGSHRGNRLNKKPSQNDSVDNLSEFSIGSILGSSFTSLNRSRSKKKGGDSTFSHECNCGFREKYIKFKNSNESLKNQLQIVKEELEVAKDLNDHFTNEIRQYFGGENESNQLERLQKDVRDLQSQREELKNKVAKYQHNIATLKSQFRLKIEQLYRKVRKER